MNRLLQSRWAHGGQVVELVIFIEIPNIKGTRAFIIYITHKVILYKQQAILDKLDHMDKKDEVLIKALWNLEANCEPGRPKTIPNCEMYVLLYKIQAEISIDIVKQQAKMQIYT